MKALGALEPSSLTGAREPMASTASAFVIERSVRLLVWSVVTILISLPVLIQERLGKDSRSLDFVYFYATSTILRDSVPENIYNREIQRAACERILPAREGSSYGSSPYPPFAALLFAPISRLPFWTAFRVHQAISLALYGLGLILLLRRFLPDLSVWTNLFVPFALAWLPWISNTLLNGQLSALGFLAMAAALTAQEAGYPFRSGLALSACLYKPTLLVLLIPLLLYRRQFRVLSGFATGAFLLIAAATLAFGWHIWSAYAGLILSLGDLERLRQLTQFVDLTAFFGLFVGNRFAGVLALLSAAAAVAFLAAAWKRYQQNPPLSWAAALTWTLILGPYVPLYDTILIIPSLIASAGEFRAGHRDSLRGALLLLFLCGWLSAASANLIHVQLLTLAIALIGSLQLAACRRTEASVTTNSSKGSAMLHGFPASNPQ